MPHPVFQMSTYRAVPPSRSAATAGVTPVSRTWVSPAERGLGDRDGSVRKLAGPMAVDGRSDSRCAPTMRDDRGGPDVGTTVTSELDEIVRVVAEHPGLLGKTEIGLVGEVFGDTDWTSGPGDDGAVVRTSTGSVVACGEALWPRSSPATRGGPASPPCWPTSTTSWRWAPSPRDRQHGRGLGGDRPGRPRGDAARLAALPGADRRRPPHPPRRRALDLRLRARARCGDAAVDDAGGGRPEPRRRGRHRRRDARRLPVLPGVRAAGRAVRGRRPRCSPALARSGAVRRGEGHQHGRAGRLAGDAPGVGDVRGGGRPRRRCRRRGAWTPRRG